MGELFIYFFIMTGFDYWQVILAGTFRALDKVEMFSVFNFVSYFCIILPLTCLFSFKIGSHTVDSPTGTSIRGLGELGTWYSFIIGLGF